MENLEHIVAQSLPPHLKKIGVALSGGADSVALLASLSSVGIECVALHCNFHLRDNESNRDQTHAENTARYLGVPIHIKHIDVPNWQNLHGGSVEMACREARYKWFSEIADALSLDAIALGHNADDNIETFFLNLFRGSGANGLKGIPQTRGIFIRPLLNVSRADIEAYLSLRNLSFVNDSTNSLNTFTRNRVRHNIIPLLNVSFPGANKQMHRSMDLLRREASFMDFAAQILIEPYLIDSSIINLQALSSHPQALMLLYRHLAPLGFNASQTGQILQAATRTGATFISSAHTATINRGKLIISPLNSAKKLPEIKIEVLPIESFAPQRDYSTALFSTDILDGDEPKLRPWQKGDRLKPFGMKGSKLVSDILTDAKIPLPQKKNITVLEKNNDIIWVPGIRHSRLYKVNPRIDSHFVKISLDQLLG